MQVQPGDSTRKPGERLENRADTVPHLRTANGPIMLVITVQNDVQAN